MPICLAIEHNNEEAFDKIFAVDEFDPNCNDTYSDLPVVTLNYKVKFSTKKDVCEFLISSLAPSPHQ